MQQTNPKKHPWVGRALGALGVALLAAVPALGLTVLKPARAAARQPGADAAVSNNPLTFDAPAATLRRYEAARPEDVRAQMAGEAPARADTVELADWQYTQFFHRHGSAGGRANNLLLLLILQELQQIQQQQLLVEQLLLQILQRLPTPQSPNH